MPPLDLPSLARPFSAARFSGPAHFRAQLLRLLHADMAEAAKGNVDGPLKSALDVLRDLRPMICAAVDYSGLLPTSHRDDFLGRFVPLNSLLSAGPALVRVEQLVALIQAEVVSVAGPGTRFGVDSTQGCFTIDSPQVPGSLRHATVFVDARVPTTDVERDASSLMRQMMRDGLVAEYVNVNPATGERFKTGGLAITDTPFHVLDRHGQPNPNMYALGLPTENTRWFTQVGSSRPRRNTTFTRDADAIAQDALGSLDKQGQDGRSSAGLSHGDYTEQDHSNQLQPAAHNLVHST